jgi:hypothetical protein
VSGTSEEHHHNPRKSAGHYCDVMEFITALSSRLLFSGCPLLIDHPFPGISRHDWFILDPEARMGTIMDHLAIQRISALSSGSLPYSWSVMPLLCGRRSA